MKTSKRDARLERVRNLVSGGESNSKPTTAGEAQRTDRIRELTEAEDVVQLILADDPENAKALFLFAELASLAGNWDQAALRWNAVIQRTSDREGMAYYRLAEAYRNTGSFHRARQAIQKVKPGGDVDADEVQLAKRKIGARENEVAARIVGNKYLRVLLKDRTDESASALLDAALVLRNDADYVAQAISNVADAITGRYSRATQLPEAGGSGPSGVTARCAFICGFGWSGSGAVYDYFIQSEGAISPFGRAEVLAFERNWSAKKLLGSLDQGYDAAVTALTQFIFQGVMGIGGPMTIEADKNKRKTILNLLRHEPSHAAALAAACSRLYADGTKAIDAASSDRLEAALRTFFDAIMAARIGPGQVGLLGNCIHSTNIDLVRLVTGARAFAIFRDPRDQYVSQVYEHKDRHRMTALGFVSAYKQRMKRYETARLAAELSNQVIPVQFEAFVLSDEVRRKIADEMGIPEPTFAHRGSSGYHPDDSVKNVGIYRSYSNGDDIALIERELGEYLFTG